MEMETLHGGYSQSILQLQVSECLTLNYSELYKDKFVLSDLFFCLLTGCLQSLKRSSAKANVLEYLQL